MKTKTLATELMYFLSAARNVRSLSIDVVLIVQIAGALKTFGILPSSEKMFVAIFDASDAQVCVLLSHGFQGGCFTPHRYRLCRQCWTLSYHPP